jgi:hypothetical protein
MSLTGQAQGNPAFIPHHHHHHPPSLTRKRETEGRPYIGNPTFIPRHHTTHPCTQMRDMVGCCAHERNSYPGPVDTAREIGKEIGWEVDRQRRRAAPTGEYVGVPA